MSFLRQIGWFVGQINGMKTDIDAVCILRDKACFEGL